MVNLSNVDLFCDVLRMGSRLPTGDRLLALKARSGLSLRAIAKASGYAAASSIQNYFNPSFNGRYLPPDVATKLVKGLAGKGKPPIQASEITELAAYVPTPPPVQLISAALAEAFVWHIAKRFGADLERDDPEVIRLGQFLQALVKLSASRQVTDADDLIAGLFAGLDLSSHDGPEH